VVIWSIILTRTFVSLLFQCLCELVNELPSMYATELDNLTSLCFRAMDGSNYDVRCEVAKLLGHLLAATQSAKTGPGLIHHRIFLIIYIYSFPLSICLCFSLYR